MQKEYELVPHTADLKIRAYGIALEELFRNALKGMFATVKPHGPEISYKNEEPIIHHLHIEHHLVVRSLNRESLLIDFLSDCLYLSDVHNEAYFDARFKELTDTEVDALIFGTPIDGYEKMEIKAVTYHDLVIEQIDQLWVATIVFDI